MLRFVRLSRLIIVTGLLVGAACSGRRQLPGTGTGGAGGGSAGAAGSAGTGGTSGTGGAPLTSCPTTSDPYPYANVACTGTFSCQFNAGCTCHGCCTAFWRCVDGVFKQTDFNDVCGQGAPCPDGGAGTSGGAGSGGAGGGGGTSSAARCTFGADQSCNDNPAISSIHGHCTDAGTCVCTFDAGANPDSGRCL